MNKKKQAQDILDRLANKIDLTFDILNRHLDKMNPDEIEKLISGDLSEIERNDYATIILLAMLRSISVSTKRDVVVSSGYNSTYRKFDKSILEKNFTYLKSEKEKQLSLGYNYTTFDEEQYPF